MANAQNSGLVRLDARGTLLGWEAVGRVTIADRGYCTGVLIATDLVLTAAHCIYDKQSGTEWPAEALSFHAGWRDGAAIAERAVAGFAAHPQYDPKIGLTIDNLRTDVALLKLQSAIPAATAAPFVLHGAAQTGQRVSVVSYGRGRDSALSWQRECGLLGRQAGILAFDCDVTFGSSGAPVFVREGARARILTLVSSGGGKDGQKRAFGMELPQAVAEVKRELRRKGPFRPARAAPKIRHSSLGGQSGNGGGAKFVKSRPRKP